MVMINSKNKNDAKETQIMASDWTIEKGSFDNFNLPESIIQKLTELKISYLYPIQCATLELIRNGQDIIAQARTGTGKTLAFGIPLVEKLEKNESKKKTLKVLILAPTRELAKQIASDFQKITTNLKIASFYGGVRYELQESELRNGLDILTGTPGRILDFIESGTLDLSTVEHIVLDEVDRMLDMGFQDSVEAILNTIYTTERKVRPQALFFSATCPEIKKLARKYINQDYTFIDLIGDSKLKTAVTVEHLAIQSSYQDRASIIGTVLQVYSGKYGRTMIFCQTKKDADELACSTEIKQESHVMHGDIPQDKRELVLEKFKSGKYKALITTDVAARGLNIPEVDLVICCSPPKDYESYVHRSGRTGRAGRSGTCVCFYKHNEIDALLQLERKTGIKFKRISSPTANEIINSSVTDAARSLDTVPEELIERFSAGAENILKSKNPVAALAAALAVISGCTEVKQRSLLSGREGFTTFRLYKTDDEIRGKSFVFAIMKKVLQEENCDHLIQRVTFTKDKTGLVFDIKTEFEEFVDSKWYNTKTLFLERLTELPELEDGWQNEANNGGSRGGGRGFGSGNGFGERRGARGGGSRFDSRSNSGRGGGFGNKGGFGGRDNKSGFNNKRKFGDSNGGGESANKKIKFTD